MSDRVGVLLTVFCELLSCMMLDAVGLVTLSAWVRDVRFVNLAVASGLLVLFGEGRSVVRDDDITAGRIWDYAR